ncbi:MAG: hypothetical protein AAF628_17620 [Planctomycetota bacterium]
MQRWQWPATIGFGGAAMAALMAVSSLSDFSPAQPGGLEVGLDRHGAPATLASTSPAATSRVDLSAAVTDRSTLEVQLRQADGAPITGALRLVRRHATEADAWVLDTRAPARIPAVDADGRAAVHFPPDWPLEQMTSRAVLVTAAGFVPLVVPLAELARGREHGGSALVLERGVEVTVQLVPDFPLALVGHLLQARSPRVFDPQAQRWLQAASSDAEGVVRFPFPFAKQQPRVALSARIPGAELTKPAFAVGVDSAPQRVLCPLVATGAMTGTVVDETGRPLVAAKLSLRPAGADGPVVTGPITDLDGGFHWPRSAAVPEVFELGVHATTARELTWLPTPRTWSRGPLRIAVAGLRQPVRVRVVDETTGAPIERFGLRIAGSAGCWQKPCQVGFHENGEVVLHEASAAEDLLVQAIPLERPFFYSRFVELPRGGRPELRVEVQRCNYVAVRLRGAAAGAFSVHLCTVGAVLGSRAVPHDWYWSIDDYLDDATDPVSWRLDSVDVAADETANLRAPSDLGEALVFVRDERSGAVSQTPIRITSGDTFLTIDAPRALVLRGRLEPALNGFESGAEVLATRADRRPCRAEVSSAGAFELKGLDPGAWQLAIKYWSGPQEHLPFAELTLLDDHSQTLDLGVAPPRTVVVDNTGTGASASVHRADQDFAAAAAAGELFYLSSMEFVPADQRATLRLPAGAYRVVLHRQGPTGAIESRVAPAVRRVTAAGDATPWTLTWPPASVPDAR